jgi:TatA/E family protein of Tat protein translocase
LFNLGPLELIAIFVVALLVFGPEKLPEIGHQVGRAVREFRRFQSTFQGDLGNALDGHLNGPVVPGPAPATTAEAAPAPAPDPEPGPEVSPPGGAAAKSEGKPPDAHQG